MLVVRRKSGQSIVIEHGGETMTVQVRSGQGKGVTMAIDAPMSFRVQREEKVSLVEGKDCLVQTARGTEKGVIISSMNGDYSVRLLTGKMAVVPKSAVSILKST